MKWLENVSLAPLTTFQIGGPARYLCEVRSERDVTEALAWAKENELRHIILGGGSNVLVPDEGLDALVVHFVGNLWSFGACEIDTWAGSNLFTLIEAAAMGKCGGWEKLAGIPGSIGGAVRGNAGAFGSEIKDFVISVRALNAGTGEIRAFQHAECDFSYRHSFFKEHPEWVITRVRLRLQQVDATESAKLAEEIIAERERRHLQNVRAAGSYFMNPVAPAGIVAQFEAEKGARSREHRVPAGWLIEKAGMKGAIVGGAIASLQHPNYLVNQNAASAADVRALAAKVKDAVRATFDIELHEEAALF